VANNTTINGKRLSRQKKLNAGQTRGEDKQVT
jgi:hypothetical protein